MEANVLAQVATTLFVEIGAMSEPVMEMVMQPFGAGLADGHKWESVLGTWVSMWNMANVA